MRWLNLSIFLSTILCTILISCSYGIKDATIEIEPYNKDNHGRFWWICISTDQLYARYEKPVVKIEVKPKDGKARIFSMDWANRCEKQNVLVTLLNKHSSHLDFELLSNSEPDDLEYIKVKVKDDPDKMGYSFEKKFLPEDLVKR